MHVLKDEPFELKLSHVNYVIRTIAVLTEIDFAFGVINILIWVTCRNTEMGLICSVSDLTF